MFHKITKWTTHQLATIPIKWRDLFKNITAYDFNPKICKNINNTSNEKLTKYGGNLLIVLKNILNDENKKKEFLSLNMSFNRE